MKYHDISPAPKLTVRRTTAVAMFEHGGILERLERAGWVRPIDKTAQIDLFSVSQLENATRRMEREPLPV